MLPRVVVRLNRVVRRLTGLEEAESEISGERNERSWYNMLARLDGRDFEIERRMKRAERSLNQLRLN